MHTNFLEILNIQIDTFSREQTKDPIVDDRPSITRTLQENLQDSEHNNCNVDPLPRKTVYFVPKLMVANTMSLAPKILEVQEFVLCINVSLAFITEIWLKPTIADYNVIRGDRSSEDHRGVCLYIKEGFSRYKKLEELSCCNDHEILWVQLQPYRLLRGFSSLIVAALYHPHWSGTENDSVRDHLFPSLSLAESKYPNCALIVAGDFNRLDVDSIKKHFRLKQIVKKPTRKNATLDLVMTNLHDYYDDPCHFPPFGPSDHDTVTAEPKVRDKSRCSTQFVLKRDKRASRKADFDWPRLFSSEESCEDMLNILMRLYTRALTCSCQ